MRCDSSSLIRTADEEETATSASRTKVGGRQAVRMGTDTVSERIRLDMKSVRVRKQSRTTLDHAPVVTAIDDMKSVATALEVARMSSDVSTRLVFLSISITNLGVSS